MQSALYNSHAPCASTVLRAHPFWAMVRNQHECARRTQCEEWPRSRRNAHSANYAHTRQSLKGAHIIWLAWGAIATSVDSDDDADGDDVYDDGFEHQQLSSSLPLNVCISVPDKMRSIKRTWRYVYAPILKCKERVKLL